MYLLVGCSPRARHQLFCRMVGDGRGKGLELLPAHLVHREEHRDHQRVRQQVGWQKFLQTQNMLESWMMANRTLQPSQTDSILCEQR